MQFAYYNEIDPYAAQWLRNLIAAGQIAPGEVDERSIEDVQADDLREFAQCHFFAGIGGWSIGLRLAGWPDDRPVWTGSCPCQPFSAAGKGQAFDDKRHLWPSWFSLIKVRRPTTIFGEQVDAAVRWGWFDAVCNDLESVGYAIGASVIPACGVGAPHIRQRLWFVGQGMDDATSSRRDGAVKGPEGLTRNETRLRLPSEGSEPCGMADSSDANGRTGIGATETGTRPDNERRRRPSGGCIDGDMADTSSGGQRVVGHETQPGQGGHANGGFWAGATFLPCTDGKARPIEPGSFPLAHGVQHRTHKLRAYGNAIVPQVAAQFVQAFTEGL